MDLIVAVYSDWGIGKDGTQPLTLRADRRFFRETTKGASVIVGRRTAADFPQGKPLPMRKNIVLTHRDTPMAGFTLCHSPLEAIEMTRGDEKVFVIGGGSVYRAMLACCERAYVTKIGAAPASDTFFPNLDESPDWQLEKCLASGVEDGVSYEICLYRRR